MEVNVNKNVLIWAREERFGKLPLTEIASQIGVEVGDLIKWEQEGTAIPFGILESLAKAYKKQTAVFFLPETPPKTKKIKDFRNLTMEGGNFSSDTLLANRRAERYLEVSRELGGSSYWSQQYEWTKYFTGKKEKVCEEATRLRTLLGSPQDGKINKKKPDEAFRYWRNKIEEKLSIFVFQFSIPEDELDGFSYAFDQFPYAIIINNKKASVRKIFTLFHELSHIFKHTPGACKTDPLSVDRQFSTELECNNFAGEFLIPRKNLKIVRTANEMYELAKPFNVSGEVYLRRLFDEKKISRDTFFSLLSEVHAKSNSFVKTKPDNSPRSRVILSKSSRGKKFFDLVVNAAVTNRISYSAASDLLELKVGNIRV